MNGNKVINCNVVPLWVSKNPYVHIRTVFKIGRISFCLPSNVDNRLQMEGTEGIFKIPLIPDWFDTLCDPLAVKSCGWKDNSGWFRRTLNSGDW